MTKPFELEEATGGQLSAISTLNIRGRRSVTRKGDFGRHPSQVSQPPGIPPICERIRQYPAAPVRAAEAGAPNLFGWRACFVHPSTARLQGYHDHDAASGIARWPEPASIDVRCHQVASRGRQD